MAPTKLALVPLLVFGLSACHPSVPPPPPAPVASVPVYVPPPKPHVVRYKPRPKPVQKQEVAAKPAGATMAQAAPQSQSPAQTKAIPDAGE
jgi:hypothetical protein